MGSWGSGGRFGWSFRRSLAARWSKMDQVGAKLAARCAQESPRCCKDGQLGCFFAASGWIPGQCWLIFGVAFAARWGVAQSMKTNNTLYHCCSILKGLRGHFSAASGKVGADGGVLWALGVWWTIRLEFSAKLGSNMEKNGPIWGEVASKLCPRVAKMLPRWLAWSIFLKIAAKLR